MLHCVFERVMTACQEYVKNLYDIGEEVTTPGQEPYDKTKRSINSREDQQAIDDTVRQQAARQKSAEVLQKALSDQAESSGQRMTRSLTKSA